MAPPPPIAPPGSSTYSSSTLNVGDGTWDSSLNSFLLPNLVGFNLPTTQYNGMGNRFSEVPEYHSVIRGHGIVAAITFLVIVPTAIMVARFQDRRPVWAIQVHIWLQIITVLLSTVIVILGFIAVGPLRALSNPHHGIGLAIYVMILNQTIGGWWVHRRMEKGRNRNRVPLTLVLHQWLGRTIALLGIIQVALGLTLYGSPTALFVLYALAVFVLVCTYFVLSYRETNRIEYGHRGSGVSRYDEYDETRSRRSSHRMRHLAEAGAAGLGLAALNRYRHRSRSRSRRGSRSRVDVAESRRSSTSRVDLGRPRPESGSFIEEEKYSRRDKDRHTWRNRLLEVGAVAGAAALAKNLLDRRRGRGANDDQVYPAGRGPYGARRHSVSEESVSRLEEGRQGSRSHRGPGLRRTQSYDSVSSRTSIDGRRQGNKVGADVATLGVFGLIKAAISGRRDRREQQRVDEVRESERVNERVTRQGSQRNRYTGDDFPRHGGRRGSLTTSTLTSNAVDSRYPGGAPQAPVAGGAPSGPYAYPPPQGGVAPLPQGAPVPMPPAPPDPQGILHQEYADSDREHRHHTARDAAAAGAVAGVAGAAVASEVAEHERDRFQPRRDEANPATPPMAVKVKLHNDNRRNVTLRKLSEQERIAEREARRSDRSSGRRRYRRDNDSDASGNEGSDRWRRPSAGPSNNPVASAQRTTATGYVPPPPQPVPVPTQPGYLPPPPPIPASGPARPGSVGSPGTYDGTTTDGSAGDAASRRQRRRAERASQGYNRSAGTVDYT